MKSAQFDLGFRPETYWPWLPTEALMLARIKGSIRRSAAAAILETGGPAALDQSLFEESLDDDERIAAGQVHPGLMGGEYLPDSRPDEIEIARIELATTMRDVISIRARSRAGRIAYGVEDEYSTTFAFRPATTARPLTLAQLIRLIGTIEAVDQPEAAWPEGTGVVSGMLNNAIEWDIEPAALVTISSEIYRELEPYYDRETQQQPARTGCASRPECYGG